MVKVFELVYTFFLTVFAVITFPMWLEGIITIVPILVAVFSTQYLLHSWANKRWLKIKLSWERFEVV